MTDAKDFFHFVQKSSKPTEQSCDVFSNQDPEEIADFSRLMYGALGLASEAGEVASKIKKILRDRQGDARYSEILEVRKELGDVLWYVQFLCIEMGASLNGLMVESMAKLQSRLDREVIGGDGDNR